MTGLSRDAVAAWLGGAVAVAPNYRRGLQPNKLTGFYAPASQALKARRATTAAWGSHNRSGLPVPLMTDRRRSRPRRGDDGERIKWFLLPIRGSAAGPSFLSTCDNFLYMLVAIVIIFVSGRCICASRKTYAESNLVRGQWGATVLAKKFLQRDVRLYSYSKFVVTALECEFDAIESKGVPPGVWVIALTAGILASPIKFIVADFDRCHVRFPII